MTTIRNMIITAVAMLPFLANATAEEWRGKWITASGCRDKANTWIAFRKTAVIRNLPPRLTARIAADSKYWLWINGTPVVFEGGLKRGPSPEGTYYDTVDIAPYLKNGDNTIAVLLWYFGKHGFSHKSSGRAGLLFDATGSDGTAIISDSSWAARVHSAFTDTGAPHPNRRLPESNIRYDARQAMDGWNTPSYREPWPAAVAVAAAAGMPFGRLVPRPIPQWKDYGLRKYTKVRRSGDTLICRLPYNCQMTPYIELHSAGSDTVRIQTDNYKGGSENNVRAEYISRPGWQSYESPGWMNGHYVWYIIPEGTKVRKVAFRETGYDTEFSGSFECDDPFLNELWTRSVRTLYITMRDTYFDCPDRERAQWWGDAVNELGEAFYALSPSSHKLAAKGIHELMNWQRDDGVIYSPVPGMGTRELPLQMLASVGWYGFYTQYYFSGDSSFVAPVYDRVHRYLHEVWQVDGRGLPVPRKGGWDWGDWGENIDMEVLTTAWYYLALKAEHRFATMLGRTDDARYDAGIMASIEEKFDSLYWNGRVYRSRTYLGTDDDRAQAMAVVSGLASPDKYPLLAEALRREHHASPYMEKYVLEALFIMGKDTLALARMRTRYAKMLSYKQYTTLFEGWGIGAEGFGGGTINHAWSGGPLTMLSQKVCGIMPTSPGFRTFRVAPQMGGLRKASAGMTTADGGRISVTIRRRTQHMSITVTVPTGSKAEVAFPWGETISAGPGRHTFSRRPPSRN